MSELWAFVQLGLQHIVSLDAADHVLFLLVVAAIYRLRDWRQVVWVISAFTVGHSITLGLAVADVLVLPQAVVEFLIPVTIVLTALENLVQRERAASGARARTRMLIVGLFGLIHGAGFAGYLRALFLDDIVTPLLGFNIGIELGQVVVLALVATLFRAFHELAAWVAPTREAFPLRMLSVSASVMLVASAWAWERFPA